MYSLMIDVANDAAFSFVAMIYGGAIFAVLIIITAIIEGIAEARERKRRRNFRNNYVKFK